MGIKEEVNHQVDELLLKVLEEKARDAEERILHSHTLSVEEAIPLLLKTQYNHIAHLDYEITLIKESIESLRKDMNERFAQIDEKFVEINEKFAEINEKFIQQIKWTVGTIIGMSAFLGLLMTAFKLF